jgi:soluble lytic murein transglycosylase
VRSSSLLTTLRSRSHVAGFILQNIFSVELAACNMRPVSPRVLHLSAFVVLVLFSLGACAHKNPVSAPTASLSGLSLACATSQACFEKAVQARRQGGSADAIDLLRKVADQIPHDRWTARANFLLGKWESENGRPEASGHLERAMVELPVIQDYALFYLGQSAMLRGDFVEAITRFDNLRVRTPESIWIPQAWYRSGEAAFTAGLYPQAGQRFEAFREIAPNDRLVPSALVYIGRSHLEQNEDEQAVSYFRQIWKRWPDLPQAQEAQLYLDQLQAKAVLIPPPTPEDRLTRVRRLSDALRYDQALQEAEALFVTEAHGPLRKPLLKQIGSLQYQLRRFDPANRSFEMLAQDLAGQPDYPEIVVWLGRIAYRRGDEVRLAEFEKELAVQPEEQGRPDLPAGQEGHARLLSLLGNLYEDHKKTEDAQATYRRLVEVFPQDPLAQEAAWRLGWMAFREGRWDSAVTEFDRFLSAYPQSPMAIQVLYWKAKSLEKLEETAQAASVYRQACQITRHSYYCRRAEEKLVILQAMATQGQGDNGNPELSEADFSTASKEPKTNPDVQTTPLIQELFLLGLEAEAADELNRLIMGTMQERAPSENKMDRFLSLNRILTEHGRYAQALRNLRLYSPEFLEKMRDDFPSDFWWIAYPQGMRNDVEAIAKESQVDPDLITAVIREESHYDPEAISSVGAIGLMQLMPTTAHWVAKRINLESYSRDQLHFPSVNVRLGAHYLAFLLDRFGGEPISAVAAYNAGPESVTRWKATVNTDDRDEFVETIPFQETRSFVKRVMRSYYEYERLQKSRQPDSAEINTGPSGRRAPSGNTDILGPSGRYDEPNGRSDNPTGKSGDSTGTNNVNVNGFLDNK